MAALIRGYTFFLCGLLYIGFSLTGMKLLGEMLLATAILALIQCLPTISKITKVVFVGLFGLGSALLFFSKASLAVWGGAVTSNVGILTLILFVPVLSIPFKFPRYQSSLEHMLQNVVQKGDNGLYLLGHGIAHLIGVIANIAAITITYYMLKAAAGGEKNTMIAKAAARGYTSTVFWSPNSGAVGLVLAYWGGAVVEIIPFGTVLAIIALAVGWAENKYRLGLEARHNERPTGQACPEITSTSEEQKTDRELGNIRNDFYFLSFAVFFLLVVVIVSDYFTVLGILLIVPILALIYPCVWALLIGEQKTQWVQFQNFIKNGLPNASNEVVIFLGAGFFAAAVGSSEIGTYLGYFFSSIAYSPTLLIAVIMAVFVLLSLVGFHPVLTATSIVASITPQALGLPPTILSVVVLAGWGLAITCSPFSACSLNLANITGVNPIIIGIRWQLLFTCLLFIVALLYFNLILVLFG
ncbi:MAG: hypothetical protein WCY82_07300 [Desulfotomaculaceae bacterium]